MKIGGGALPSQDQQLRNVHLAPRPSGPDHRPAGKPLPATCPRWWTKEAACAAEGGETKTPRGHGECRDASFGNPANLPDDYTLASPVALRPQISLGLPLQSARAIKLCP